MELHFNHVHQNIRRLWILSQGYSAARYGDIPCQVPGPSIYSYAVAFAHNRWLTKVIIVFHSPETVMNRSFQILMWGFELYQISVCFVQVCTVVHFGVILISLIFYTGILILSAWISPRNLRMIGSNYICRPACKQQCQDLPIIMFLNMYAR